MSCHASDAPGSSPRGRGKRRARSPAVRRARLIPAWAGKTSLNSVRLNVPPAHPRVGGENAREELVTEASDGSSPRGRGKRESRPDQLIVDRLIPAWAGKTQDGSPRRMGIPAHPRVGGENSTRRELTRPSRGSSPRGRGKQSATRSRRKPGRLIPAWAGKTPYVRGSPTCPAAHPRVGGENPPLASYTI